MPSDLPPFKVSFEDNRFVNLPLTRMQSSVMPVVVADGDLLVCAGTAFTIATFANCGVMLTAKHVVEGATKYANGDEALIAVLYVAPGTGRDVPDLLGGLLPVTRVSFGQSADPDDFEPNPDILYPDLAILQVQLPFLSQPLVLPRLPLSPGLPEKGTRILTLGYSRLVARSLGHGSKESAFELSQDFSASNGEIVEMHPLRRGLGAMYQFPSFQTNARYDFGMSGGPVVSASNGRVCGVVASGMDDSISYASLLAPAFSLDVVVSNGPDKEETVSLLELTRRGFVETDDTISNLEIRRNDDGTHQLRYR